MVWKGESKRAEDFCNYLSLYVIRTYSLPDPEIVNFTFTSYEHGEYGYGGEWFDLGKKTELDFTNGHLSWSLDNEDLADIMAGYFSGS